MRSVILSEAFQVSSLITDHILAMQAPFLPFSSWSNFYAAVFFLFYTDSINILSVIRNDNFRNGQKCLRSYIVPAIGLFLCAIQNFWRYSKLGSAHDYVNLHRYSNCETFKRTNTPNTLNSKTHGDVPWKMKLLISTRCRKT